MQMCFHIHVLPFYYTKNYLQNYVRHQCNHRQQLRWENVETFSQTRIYSIRSQWCELENLVIDQRFVAVFREMRR
jgi:hypothetical protein